MGGDYYSTNTHSVLPRAIAPLVWCEGEGQWGETTILPTHSVLPRAIAPLVWWLQVIWLVV